MPKLRFEGCNARKAREAETPRNESLGVLLRNRAWNFGYQVEPDGTFFCDIEEMRESQETRPGRPTVIRATPVIPEHIGQIAELLRHWEGRITGCSLLRYRHCSGDIFLHARASYRTLPKDFADSSELVHQLVAAAGAQFHEITATTEVGPRRSELRLDFGSQPKPRSQSEEVHAQIGDFSRMCCEVLRSAGIALTEDDVQISFVDIPDPPPRKEVKNW